MPDHDFAHEPDARRYVMREGDRLVGVLDYSILGNTIALTRAFTQPPFRGHGYAAELVEFAVDDLETSTAYRIVPNCWYVAAWFERHPEHAALLSR
ncbi:GNAT family N-acetyltransferase [Luethyella okanaganae]|uniref:GNAT family N-acetyltransferase n=1 Tax=Luethyella okanaganae TaxID=69372 RepID=A0ABW1VHL9_9MICO